MIWYVDAKTKQATTTIYASVTTLQQSGSPLNSFTEGAITNTTTTLLCHAWQFLKFRKALQPVKQWSNLLHNLNCSNISRTILDSMPMQRRDHHDSASQITKRFANERNMHNATDSKGCGSSKLYTITRCIANGRNTHTHTHTQCTTNMGKRETLNYK